MPHTTPSGERVWGRVFDIFGKWLDYAGSTPHAVTPLREDDADRTSVTIYTRTVDMRRQDEERLLSLASR